MAAPPAETSDTAAAACYESGGADPDFYFPAARLPADGSHRERISTLPGRLLKLIRR